MREIAKVALLLLSLLALNAPLADWYRERVMRLGIGERTARQFKEERHGIDTLVLGDSHAKRGVYPRILKRAFNLAIPGQTYAETYYVLKSHIELGEIDLRHVILQADLHSFSSWGLDRFPLAHLYAPYVDYFEMGWRRGKPLVYAVRELQGRYVPYLGERKNLLSYLQHGTPADLSWLIEKRLEGGALVHSRSIRSQSPKRRTEAAETRCNNHFANQENFSPFLEQYFRQILELCADNGIEVILVEYPVTTEYLKAAARYIDSDEFDRRLAALIAPYENVQLFAAREIFERRLDTFVDGDHLNQKGAITLSRMIRAQILDELRAQSGAADAPRR
jgi:hypothetical protein